MRHNAWFKGHFSRKSGVAQATPATAPLLTAIVCVCQRMPFDCDSKGSFLCIATAGRYLGEPTSTASKGASSRLKKVFLQSVLQKLNHEVRLCMAARRLPKSSSRESRLYMGGLRREATRSILSVFYYELLRVSVGCTCTHVSTCNH